MERTSILGPFMLKKSLGLLAITETSIYLIRLNVMATIKHGALTSLTGKSEGHFDRLKSKPLKYLTSKYKWTKLDFDDDFIIELVRNKILVNFLRITIKDKVKKWTILERNETDKYEEILKPALGKNFK
ncbi:MAG: hypothetical protein IIA45_07530 [Bacteroidetes bacterium]|nr:hypothetical protein [Bacteroidota bacterium]